jgi:tetratricopeptide (TPR) repeat protein
MRVTPYHVIRKLLRSVFHISDTDSSKEQVQTITDHLSLLGLDEKEILPYLLYVLEIPQPNPFYQSQLRILDPAILQKQTYAALRSIFAAEARLSEIVYVIDDLHWADQASREFLDYFSQAIDQNPILLILVSRDFESTPVLQAQTKTTLLSLGKINTLEIEPLTQEEALVFVNNIIKHSEPKLDGIKVDICRRAEGNPYFIEALLRLVIEKGGLIQVEGSWRTTTSIEEVIEDIPDSLRDIILSRFDRLPKTLQQVLQKAAILGPSFALFLLETQLDVDQKTLDDTLALLVQKEFLTLTEEELDKIYSFKQTIVREAIYNTILRRDRMNYHYQAAQTIKTFTFWLPGERSEILAYHLSQSMRPLEAIKYLVFAGENALEHFANHIAIKHFRDALNLIKDSEQSNLLERARAEIGLGKAFKYAGKFEQAATYLQQIISELAPLDPLGEEMNHRQLELLIEAFREQADLRAREGRLDDGLVLLESGIELLGESAPIRYPDLWRRLIDRVAWIYFRQGKLDLAIDTAAPALENATNWGDDDPITLASLNNTMGGISWMQSRYEDAIAYVQNSLEIYRKLDYFWGRSIASTNLGVLYFTSGNWVDAVKYFEQAESIQIEYGYTPDRPTNLKNLGEVLMNLGYHKSARRHLTKSQQISQQLGMRINEAYAEIGLCRLSIYEKNFEEAREHHRNASTLLQESVGEVDDRNISLMLLEALILVETGSIDQAYSLSRQALEKASESGFLAEKSEAQRVYGQICARMGEYDLAEKILQDAVDLAREQDNPYKEAQAHYELGLLYCAQTNITTKDDPDQGQNGHTETAKSELNLAIKLFTQLGASYDLEKAAHALNPLGRD